MKWEIAVHHFKKPVVSTSWYNSAVPTLGGFSVLQPIRQADERRVRLTLSVAVYGAVVSVAALYISLTTFSSTTYPFEPQRPMLGRFLFVSLGAILSGVLLAGAPAHFVGDDPGQARHPLVWLLIGVLYGVLVPFMTGIFMPFCVVFQDLVTGRIGLGDLWPRLADAPLSALLCSIQWGFLGLLTGLRGGFLLGVGGWSISLANAALNPKTAKYGPWVICAALSLVVLTMSLLAPLSLVKRLSALTSSESRYVQLVHHQKVALFVDGNAGRSVGI